MICVGTKQEVCDGSPTARSCCHTVTYRQDKGARKWKRALDVCLGFSVSFGPHFGWAVGFVACFEIFYGAVKNLLGRLEFSGITMIIINIMIIIARH